MRRRAISWAFACFAPFLFALLHAPTSGAQADGYVTNSNLRGVVASGSYQFGAIDNINLGTGTLNLNIPIKST